MRTKHLQHILFLAIALPFCLPISSGLRIFTLDQGSSLTPEKNIVLSSPNGDFAAGFYPIGENAYCFAIWFTGPSEDGSHAIVWMANRDQPVNGRLSKLSLLKSGDLVLTDAAQFIIWQTSSKTNSSYSSRLQLHDNGNLVLCQFEHEILWQSFDSPTDTLLPGQPLTKTLKLVSSRSQSDHSSGSYKLAFRDDNVLFLLYDGFEITSVYWPVPWRMAWDEGRSTYNNSRTAVLDSLGSFMSSDFFQFNTSDYGDLRLQRRFKITPDGNIMVYSRKRNIAAWEVTWQVSSQPCKIHGICGGNAVCTNSPRIGRSCSCLPGYKMRNLTDLSYGCVPEFQLSCKEINATGFLEIRNVEFYGYDLLIPNHTLETCQQLCLRDCDCRAFHFRYDDRACFPKLQLFNGYQSVGVKESLHIKLPKALLESHDGSLQREKLQCYPSLTPLKRSYTRGNQHGWLKSFSWFTIGLGAIEIICLATYFYRTRRGSKLVKQSYIQVATSFKRFTYSELIKASKNFSDEIGRGGGGVVYRAVLPDGDVAAVKSLTKQENQGEAEFLAEVSIIGKINHMNLIEIWGYCVEKEHRLLVYEYMENGSLAENLRGNKLDWDKRFEIAVRTAKGLAYLHEECLDWVLHCDVKPQNILLDKNFHPKVADFGLSKLFNRSSVQQREFSRIRGTRGYMAPEWILNLPITSKVDVYSYGVVVLEMITGKSPMGAFAGVDRHEARTMLVSFVREKMEEAAEGDTSWILEVMNSDVDGECDMDKMEILVKIALQCTEENKDRRPTMSQVVDMLLHQ